MALWLLLGKVIIQKHLRLPEVLAAAEQHVLDVGVAELQLSDLAARILHRKGLRCSRLECASSSNNALHEVVAASAAPA